MSVHRESSSASASAPARGRWLSRRSAEGRDPLQERIDCLMGVGTSLVGDLVFAGGLRVDGRIRGDVTVSNIQPGTLVIGDEGVIEGDIRVSHLIVYGEVRGTVYASGVVDVRSAARMHGDVHYGSLEIQSGAVIEGHLIPHRQSGESA